MIRVESKINIYERNGQRNADPYTDNLIVKSDPIFNDRVVIVYGEVRLTVVASDLHAAIANACNSGQR